MVRVKSITMLSEIGSLYSTERYVAAYNEQFPPFGPTCERVPQWASRAVPAYVSAPLKHCTVRFQEPRRLLQVIADSRRASTLMNMESSGIPQSAFSSSVSQGFAEAPGKHGVGSLPHRYSRGKSEPCFSLPRGKISSLSWKQWKRARMLRGLAPVAHQHARSRLIGCGKCFSPSNLGICLETDSVALLPPSSSSPSRIPAVLMPCLREAAAESSTSLIPSASPQSLKTSIISATQMCPSARLHEFKEDWLRENSPSTHLMNKT